MEMIGLLYPLSVFVFVRLAMYCFGTWAVQDDGSKWLFLLLGVGCVAFAFDSGGRLINMALFAPYIWLLPLVLFALAYVVFRSFRKTFSRMSTSPAQLASSDH